MRNESILPKIGRMLLHLVKRGNVDAVSVRSLGLAAIQNVGSALESTAMTKAQHYTQFLRFALKDELANYCSNK